MSRPFYVPIFERKCLYCNKVQIPFESKGVKCSTSGGGESLNETLRNLSAVKDIPDAGVGEGGALPAHPILGDGRLIAVCGHRAEDGAVAGDRNPEATRGKCLGGPVNAIGREGGI